VIRKGIFAFLIAISAVLDADAFTVTIDGARDVNFMDLVNAANGADKLIFRNSIINMNVGDMATVPIEISGNVVFLIQNVNTVDNYILFANASGNIPNVGVINPGLFNVQTYRDGDAVMLAILRNTDYADMLGGGRGQFLNNARSASSNSRLLAQLDNAGSFAELNYIVNNSVAFRPGRLMRPIKILSQAYQAGHRVYNMDGTLNPISIIGDEISVYSNLLTMTAATRDMNFGIYLRHGYFDNDGLDEFSGQFTGGGIHAAIYRDIFHISILAGIDYARFETLAIYDGYGGQVYDPSGFAGHAVLDMGAKVLDINEFFIMPMLRIYGFYGKVLYDDYTDVTFAAGVRTGYATSDLGIITEYSLYGLAEAMPSGAQAGIRVDMIAPRDSVGGWMDLGVMKNDLGVFYKIGAGLRYLF